MLIFCEGRELHMLWPECGGQRTTVLFFNLVVPGDQIWAKFFDKYLYTLSHLIRLRTTFF